ncbi:MAG: hypothetical protein WCJ25_02775 [Candidatus Moraniibacteriota bacterium]
MSGKPIELPLAPRDGSISINAFLMFSYGGKKVSHAVAELVLGAWDAYVLGLDSRVVLDEDLDGELPETDGIGSEETPVDVYRRYGFEVDGFRKATLSLCLTDGGTEYGHMTDITGGYSEFESWESAIATFVSTGQKIFSGAINVPSLFG